MPRFIVALLVDEPSFFLQYAQRFADIAAGYLLGVNVHPHITLAQFDGKQSDFDALLEVLQQPLDNIQVRVLGMHFGFPVTMPGRLWAALSVARDPQVLALHELVIAFLEQRPGVVIHTVKRNLFDPHITLALINGNIPACPTPVIPELSVSVAAGIADSLGQFIEIKRVFPKARQLTSSLTSAKCRL